MGRLEEILRHSTGYGHLFLLHCFTASIHYEQPDTPNTNPSEGNIFIFNINKVLTTAELLTLDQ